MGLQGWVDLNVSPLSKQQTVLYSIYS